MKKRRLKWKNIITALLFLIFLTIFIICIVYIINWLIDKNRSKNISNDVLDNTEVVEINDSDNTKLIGSDIDENDPYWYYTKMNLIDVDIDKLIKANKDTIGWIYVGGTNVNYPFVQTTNNDYYLTHSFDKSKNNAGWVFMDYRNNSKSFGKNTILYAHGRYDNTMFGSLKKIITSSWLNNKDNYIVKLSTKYENTLWQVFSVYKIKTTTDYIQTDFVNNEFSNFIELIKNRSIYNFNTEVRTSDKILTLSTCYNNEEKIVLHAKLIKKEKK